MSSATAKKIADYHEKRSLALIALHARRDGFKLVPVEVEPAVPAHWVALIIVSSPQVRIIFRTHFMLREGRGIASGVYGTTPAALPAKKTMDFFREFCNLIGGDVKTALSLRGQSSAVSLPILLRGFDEIFYGRPSGSFHSFWKIGDGKSHFFCSTQIEILKSFEIDLQDADAERDKGEVEFF